MKSGNFVAKYNWKVNKAKVYKDRKKEMKKGYTKHKKGDDCPLLLSQIKFCF